MLNTCTAYCPAITTHRCSHVERKHADGHLFKIFHKTIVPQNKSKNLENLINKKCMDRKINKPSMESGPIYFTPHDTCA